MAVRKAVIPSKEFKVELDRENIAIYENKMHSHIPEKEIVICKNCKFYIIYNAKCKRTAKSHIDLVSGAKSVSENMCSFERSPEGTCGFVAIYLKEKNHDNL